VSNNRDRIVGAWSLTDFRRFRDGAFRRHPMGEQSRGRIIYSDSGYMCAFLMTERWATGQRPLEDVEFLSYSGKFRVEGDTVFHEVDSASDQKFIGRILVRRMQWGADGQLTLVTEDHVSTAGATSHNELVWRKDG
jgi:hypothetical protein